MLENLPVLTDSELALVSNENILSELLKPLVQEIFLFDTWVAGTTHLADKSVLSEIKPDDRLTMKRENNKFDENAILLYAPSGKKLGYVPEADNVVFARLMDAGKHLTSYVRSAEFKTESFMNIRIAIYLVDF